jgi:hypothetical protein
MERKCSRAFHSVPLSLEICKLTSNPFIFLFQYIFFYFFFLFFRLQWCAQREKATDRVDERGRSDAHQQRRFGAAGQDAAPEKDQACGRHVLSDIMCVLF